MKNTLFILFVLFFSYFQSSAQIQFGVQLAVDQTRLDVEPNEAFNTQFSDVYGENLIGFSLGILTRLKLTKRIGFSVQPSIAFQESELNYELISAEINKIKTESVVVQVPAQIEYHFARIPLHPYLIGGAKAFFDVSKEENPEFKLKDTGWAIYGGIGLEIPTKKFLFHPELVYAYNPADMLDTDFNFASIAAIDNMRLDVVSLRLNFSGRAN